MTIQIEEVPNHQIINFYPPVAMYQSGKVLVADNQHSSTEPVVRRILAFEGVVRCLFSDVSVSVKYTHNHASIRLNVLAELDDFAEDGCQPLETVSTVSDLETAEAVADAFIRPTLSRDKGGLDILALKDGVLSVRFTGHCAGCPYAQNTLQNVIIRTLQKYMPFIRDVQLEE